jgi:GNAT superfamily N-acetyltransferase
MTVINVPRSRAEEVMTVMVRAFNDDPATRWMFPDQGQYLTHFPTFVRLYAFDAFEKGIVHGVEGIDAYAMWLTPGAPSDDGGINELLIRCTPKRRHSEIFELIAEMASFRTREPHWFLPLIGVDQMGQGYGSALMKHMLARCDAEHRIAYLDNTNEANCAFYEQHGFRKLGVVRVASCPPVYPMLRDPAY